MGIGVVLHIYLEVRTVVDGLNRGLEAWTCREQIANE